MSGSTEDYLKTIFVLNQSVESVPPGMLADRLKISPAAVTKMIKHLKEKRLVSYTRGSGIALTRQGRLEALVVLRRHRLIEMFLVKALGYRWDQVHDEAERLEHSISELFEEKIDAFLGRPAFDPHGDPIPSKSGEMPDDICKTLDTLKPGAHCRIQRVADRDRGMLKLMEKMGLMPGARLYLLREDPYGGSLYVSIQGEEQAVGRELAANIFVTVD